MNKKTSDNILEILNKIIINPKPELNYRNNYELTCAVILSAQTKDSRVNLVTPKLFNLYDNYDKLALANINELEKIIEPLGFHHNKAINLINMAKMVIDKYNGILPNELEKLTKLPGIGRKTASVILALGFNVPAFPVDTHLIRMANVFGYSKSQNPLIVENDYKKYIIKDNWILAHHLFLLFGRYHCMAINPKCDNCELIKYCKKRNNLQKKNIGI